MHKIIGFIYQYLFDSFDGANNLETAEGKVDLISLRATLANKHLLSNYDYATIQSNSILTWMQASAKEEAVVLMSVLENHYRSRYEFSEHIERNGSKIVIFDCHGEKMTRNFTHHSK